MLAPEYISRGILNLQTLISYIAVSWFVYPDLMRTHIRDPNDYNNDALL